VQGTLAAALAELPATWRVVVIARDVLERDPAEVSEGLGLSLEQRQVILNQARAVLREGLDRPPRPGRRPVSVALTVAAAPRTLRRLMPLRLHRTLERIALRSHVALTYRTMIREAGVRQVILLAALVGLLPQAVFEFGPLWLVALAAQAVLAWLLAIISIRAGKLLHDGVPSNLRAGVSSGVGTLSWMLFLPFSLVFGWFARSQGVQRAGWFLTGAAVLIGLLLIVSALHRPPPAAAAGDHGAQPDEFACQGSSSSLPTTSTGSRQTSKPSSKSTSAAAMAVPRTSVRSA
jgi:hypothetical protein